ncbi:MAG: RNA polymerase factor sigma-54 [Pseudomonadota bacterium]|nr:RNA polymerase factor sigma-54 [Pseudomonadota bacterium]
MIGPQLSLRQNQSLAMTPQLVQAIKLLKMTNLEVSSFLKQQVEQNPLLVLEDTQQTYNRSLTVQNETEFIKNYSQEEYGDQNQNSDLGIGESNHLPSSRVVLEERGANRDNFSFSTGHAAVDWMQGATDSSTSFKSDPSGGNSFAYSVADKVTDTNISLRDYLLGQVNVDFNTKIERSIGARLIDMLDESGWFSGDLQTVSEALGCSTKMIEDIFYRCQHFDPPGVFCRSLSECLELQLREVGRLDRAMRKLLNNLPLLAKRDYAAIKRVCEVDDKDLSDMISEIKKLNPKPGEIFDREVAQTIVPDVFVKPGKFGWVVELNNSTLPNVLVNYPYYSEIQGAAHTESDREFIRVKFQSANWLVRALAQRAETILKVATELVAQQEFFLERGVEFLRPLNLRDIAEVIGVHESTVSRVTTNKYLSVNSRIFHMKYFFDTGIGQGEACDGVSAESLRARIKTIIDRESADSVLSDDSIVSILQNQGIGIARRTVAKYRYSMNIPSSVQRRRKNATQG